MCMWMGANYAWRLCRLDVVNVRRVVHVGIEVHITHTWHVFRFDSIYARIHYDYKCQDLLQRR